MQVGADEEIDTQRTKRLLVGLVVGAASLGALVSAAGQVRADPPPPEPPPILEVLLEETIPPEEPAAPETPQAAAPESPAAPAAAAPAPAAPAPKLALQTPTTPPTELPNAADPYNDAGPGPGSPNGSPGGKGTSGGAATPSPAPTNAPPPVPKGPPPPPNPADYTPPKCKQRGIDGAAAKATGVEGRVVVKYTVTASGAVTAVRAESGPTELRALAVAAVSSWSCEPARMKADGTPLQLTRSAPLTVRFSSS